MASTYSPSLRLELMATGDQSGTWGDTTNTNLGTLLEQAITGVLSVAEGDAELTLTALDGASDQARNMVVNLTGAMTGAQNVIVPTAEKLYLIKNSTTGGFAVTVKTAAGTGIAVAAGTAQWVYCDGTNVVQGLSGTMAVQAPGAVAITGGSITGITDLAVADGGTGLSTLTTNNVILGNGASAPNFVAPGTSGNVLTSNGTTWESTAPGGGFPSGTLMLFQQTSAPTGWTKETTHNDKALRVVSGTASSGGSSAFSTVFSKTATDDHTLTTAQLATHAHNKPADGSGVPGGFNTWNLSGTNGASTATDNAGSSSAHSHGMDIRVQYVDIIIASKD